MQDLWKNECQKELKSVEIWKRKQSWLERYEEEYDSRNIFRKEENTLVEYNNRGYRILLSSSCSPKINFGLNLFGNTGISLSSHVS
jgi:hypothetical protein